MPGDGHWLSRVATAIAAGQPSLTLVINGGQITYDDIGRSLRAGRPVIILAGTGRAADTIAAAARGDIADPKAAQAAAAPGTRIVFLMIRKPSMPRSSQFWPRAGKPDGVRNHSRAARGGAKLPR